MDRLYALGARQRNLLIKNEEDWNLYESALIVELDLKSGSVRSCVEYKSPSEVRAHEHSSMVFKAGTIVGNTLYACTATEVLIFSLPEFQQTGYVSFPALNDVHHVTPTSDGNLLVANTGLDMVVKFTLQGEVLSEWAVLDEELWSRFSRDIDYRKVDSTKPHQSHPNFVFELNGENWVTRFKQRDAICLDQRSKRIDIAVQSPHDGLICGDRIYFTTVDGRIVIANPRTLQVDEIVDLKQINGSDALLGWCRGILPLDERRIWVGFTRVRKTKLRENVLWVKNVFRPGTMEKATHLALYDIVDRRCLQEFDLEPYGMNIVFSVLPVVRAPPEAITTTSTQASSFCPSVQSPTEETIPLQCSSMLRKVSIIGFPVRRVRSKSPRLTQAHGAAIDNFSTISNDSTRFSRFAGGVDVQSISSLTSRPAIPLLCHLANQPFQAIRIYAISKFRSSEPVSRHLRSSGVSRGNHHRA